MSDDDGCLCGGLNTLHPFSFILSITQKTRKMQIFISNLCVLSLRTDSWILTAKKTFSAFFSLPKDAAKLQDFYQEMKSVSREDECGSDLSRVQIWHTLPDWFTFDLSVSKKPSHGWLQVQTRGTGCSSNFNSRVLRQNHCCSGCNSRRRLLGRQPGEPGQLLGWAKG